MINNSKIINSIIFVYITLEIISLVKIFSIDKNPTIYTWIHIIIFILVTLFFAFYLFNKKSFETFTNEQVTNQNTETLTDSDYDPGVVKVNVNAKNGDYVVYWLLNKYSNDKNTWDRAYNEYKTSGIAKVINGFATLEIRTDLEEEVKDRTLVYRISKNNNLDKPVFMNVKA